MDIGFTQIDLKQEASLREKIYFAVILLLIVVAFARWFYIPKLQQTKLAKVEVKNQQLQIDTLKEFAKIKIPEVIARPQEGEFRTGSKFEKAMAASMKSQQQVVADIVKVLTSHNILGGVSLVGISFGNKADKGMYSSVPMTVEVEGQYSKILNYFGYIEKLGKLVTIDNVEINRKEGTASTIHTKADMSIYVVHDNSAAQVEGQAGGVK